MEKLAANLAARSGFGQQTRLAKEEVDRGLACLAQSPEWVYAQLVAQGIQSEFECKPTDPNWNTYTLVSYAFQRLFDAVKQRAKLAKPKEQSILAEISKDADRTRRNPEPASQPTRRRARPSR